MKLRNLLSTPESVVAAFVLLATLWGTSFVAIEAGLHHFPPLLFAGVRYAIAGAIVLGVAAVMSGRTTPSGRDEWLGVAVAATFVIAAYHGLLYVGELHISGAVAAVVVSLVPVLTAVFAAVLLPNERLGPVEIGGFALGVLGVVVIADPTAAGAGNSALLGVGLAFAGAVAFSLGAVLLRPLRTDLPIAALQGWAMVLGAGILFVGAAALGESPSAIEWNRTAIVSLAYLTLLSGVLAFLIYFALLDEVGPAQLHLVGYAEPVVAAAGSWVLLGTLVEAEAIVGFVAILAGFLALERREIAAYVGFDAYHWPALIGRK
ncbi:EamA family transporter [Halorubrum sp. Ib24]|uniref:DMT family transporter n=1 Tax=unclassified Halorubrum TaxID=2642239 RepID=UPI000B99323E|nr:MULTISPECIES: DMT family transporter [unclassified Halorubrum]OYR39917.1 EamA family transporter [Halorubrum sp. Ib24]OYR48292.1 EamA family transporter [Halorubrum sp. Eb13]OYR48922.1 EamA family transporter [Halorubrum sp. Ea1]